MCSKARIAGQRLFELKTLADFPLGVLRIFYTRNFVTSNNNISAFVAPPFKSNYAIYAISKIKKYLIALEKQIAHVRFIVIIYPMAE